MPKIRLQQITDTTSFERLAPHWNKLHQQSSIQSVFLTWEWLFTWWQHYGSLKKLWVLTAWEDENLVGAAPLMIVTKKKYGVKFRILKPLSSPDCDVSGFLIAQGKGSVLEQIGTYILQHSSMWDVIQFTEFAREHDQTKFLLQFFLQARLLRHIISARRFYIPINSDWDAYYNQLPKNLKNDIKRRLKRAEEHGEITIRRFTGSDVRAEHFQTIFKINETGHFPYLYQSAQDQSFHLALMERMKDLGWVEIYFLYLSGTPLAFRYGFMFNGKFEDWRNGFSQALPHLSPGKLLTHFIIKDQFQRGNQEYDFLRGSDEYKNRWHPLVREYSELRIVSPQNLPAAWFFIYLPRLKILWQAISYNNGNDKTPDPK